ncbi:sulfotransferase domain-containing protein [Algiphilus aromaticivorans]|uniref:sulfotransferase domain-containing protein n=1 Tax=Algiphilus aromaticivorans TaxID=382454 RepID=UPI0022B378D9|nr:sulfotransferase domain-containing protein [Algiphilus aromaticivorans]
MQVPRAGRRLIGKTRAGSTTNRPIIVNSIPKSGTHLLMQVARALPNTPYYGAFIAQTPSISLRMRTDKEICRKLSSVVPGEVVGAHLHHSEPVRETLTALNAVHLMIVRDPVDILLSEAHYLGSMNRFHRMAREFKGLGEEQRIQMALHGSKQVPSLFPEFPNRINPYLGWLRDPSVMVVRYEDINDLERRHKIVEAIVKRWYSGDDLDGEKLQSLVASCVNAINPEKSHTASRRRSSSSREKLKSHELVADLRDSLGYR